MKTYRFRGHSVSDPGSYRTKEEVEHYKTLDPLIVTEQKILDKKIASESEIQAIKDKIHIEIDEAVEFAENSSFPKPEALYDDNYVQENYPFIMD